MERQRGERARSSEERRGHTARFLRGKERTKGMEQRVETGKQRQGAQKWNLSRREK